MYRQEDFHLCPSSRESGICCASKFQKLKSYDVITSLVLNILVLKWVCNFTKVLLIIRITIYGTDITTKKQGSYDVIHLEARQMPDLSELGHNTPVHGYCSHVLPIYSIVSSFAVSTDIRLL